MTRRTMPMPARCEDCGRAMEEGGTCALRNLVLAGRSYPRILWMSDQELNCRDCAVRPGAIHHRYCSQERCPRCDGQLISCDCPGPAPEAA
jgi:hypothetical protein